MARGELPVPSVASSRLARRPCFELLCTNMLSDIAKSGPSTLTCVAITTCVVFCNYLLDYQLIKAALLRCCVREIDLPGISSYHVGFRHFSDNFDYISGRTSGKICKRRTAFNTYIILTTSAIICYINT